METETKFTPIAVHIAAPRTAHVLGVLDPTLNELDYDEDLHDHYVVFDYPENGKYLIMTNSVFHDVFEESQETWFFQPTLATPR